MTMNEFRNQLARLRFIDRDDLPDGRQWDEDWLLFRDDPFRYFLACSDKHQEDIWKALERDRTRTAVNHTNRLIHAFRQVFG